MLRDNQNGNTMLEALAALAVVGVLAYSALKLVNGMFDLFHENMTVTQIKELKKKIAEKYSVETDYVSLDDASVEDLVNDKVIPANMIIGNKIYHRLSGEVEISTSSLDDIYYDITFKGLPQKACINLSMIDWVINQNSDLIKIDINGKVYALAEAGGSDDDFPVTAEKAAKACVKGRSNEITWTFQ